jgi:hypothetical protein
MEKSPTLSGSNPSALISNQGKPQDLVPVCPMCYKVYSLLENKKLQESNIPFQSPDFKAQF